MDKEAQRFSLDSVLRLCRRDFLELNKEALNKFGLIFGINGKVMAPMCQG